MGYKNAETYAKLRLLNPKAPKAECIRQAGYSDSTSAYKVEHTQTYKDIVEETKRAAQAVNVTPEVVLGTLKRSMDRSKDSHLHDATANQAAKISADILGMQAPIQVNTEVVTKQQTLIAILGRIKD